MGVLLLNVSVSCGRLVPMEAQRGCGIPLGLEI